MVGFEPTSCRACAFSAIDHHNRIPIYQLSYTRIKVAPRKRIELLLTGRKPVVLAVRRTGHKNGGDNRIRTYGSF
jgi:hypothetical protein